MEPLRLTRLRHALDENYILVLTTNSHEKKAVTSCLSHSAKAELPIKTEGARLGICGDQLVLHVTGTAGAQADNSVGRITRSILRDKRLPRPTAVILTGIIWGVPGSSEFGDVILCGELTAINQIRFEQNGWKYVPVDRKSKWAEELPSIVAGIASTRSLKIREGKLASGEHHIANTDVRDGLIAVHDQIAGGEMEGWDLVPDLDGLPWLQLRGVSDFAETGLGRYRHDVAALSAAACLAPLILELTARKLIMPTRQDPAAVGLTEVLTDEAIQITAPIDDLGLNNHLNDRLGPSIAWRISQYSVGVSGSPSLPRSLTNLVLEMAQNALRYGSASAATVTFGQSSLTYVDDGRTFDTRSLIENPDGRGGRKAMMDLTRNFIDKGIVDFVRDTSSTGKVGNKYKITFLHLTSELRKAKDTCQIDIKYKTFGEIGEFGEALDFDDRCETLFYDACGLIMSSRLFDVTSELRKLLIAGKALYIQCFDDHEKAEFEDALSDCADERLNVFIGGS